MKKINKKQRNRRGVVFVLAMIFVGMLATITVATATMSSANAQISVSHKQGNRAMANALSGLEVVNYLFDRMIKPESKDTAVIQSSIESQLAAKGLTGLTVTVSSNTITISNTQLSGNESDSFSAQISTLEPKWKTVITGSSNGIDRRIRVEFRFMEQGNSVFNFGVATKGPLLMSGQAELSGVNLAVESDVLIDASTTGNSFEIGNKASVEGNVHIVDPYATYDIGSNSEIGGATGDEAEANVHLGVDAVDFPTPDPDYFRQYATGETLDSTSDISSYDVLENVTIAANTNPTFSSDTTIKGVLFVEQPNNVKFSGKVTVQGIIVGDTDPGTVMENSSFDFSGQVNCIDTGTLEGAQFDGIKNETGTFLISPGSVLDFSGQANMVNGVIACGGARFTGQAGGTINGSIINYSGEAMVMQGQGTLSFNRSGSTENPAGFTPVYRLKYDPGSYEELHN